MCFYGLSQWLQGLEVLQSNNTKVCHLRTCRIWVLPGLSKYKATSPVNLTPFGSPSQLPVPTPALMLTLEGEEENPALVPNPTQPVGHAPSERNSTPPATPPIVHMPLPAPVEPPAPDLCRTSCILCPPSKDFIVIVINGYLRNDEVES